MRIIYDPAIVYDGIDRQIFDAVALIEISFNHHFIGLYAHDAVIADNVRIFLDAEHNIDLLVLAKNTDQHAARAPDGALMMRAAGRSHDFTEIASGIYDSAGNRHALGLVCPRWRRHGDKYRERCRHGTKDGSV